MVERIRDLLDRFPENEEAVTALIECDRAVASLCDEYREIATAVHRLERELAHLRERRARLEEDLLSRIEGYVPM